MKCAIGVYVFIHFTSAFIAIYVLYLSMYAFYVLSSVNTVTFNTLQHFP